MQQITAQRHDSRHRQMIIASIVRPCNTHMQIYMKFRNILSEISLSHRTYLFSMPERLLVSNFMHDTRVDYVII